MYLLILQVLIASITAFTPICVLHTRKYDAETNFKFARLNIFWLKLLICKYFSSLEVVGGGSETQLQMVGGGLNSAPSNITNKTNISSFKLYILLIGELNLFVHIITNNNYSAIYIQK